MTGFVLLRAGAHRLLLAAALLAVLLTTCVLSALTAFSGQVGDAALRESLRGPAATTAALVLSADVPPDRREAARAAVERGARATFPGLPVTLGALERSGPYALPAGARRGDAASGAGTADEPDLTHLAALDRGRIALASGTWPGPAPAGAPVPVALPEHTARLLGLRPGTELKLTDRLAGTPLTVRITGLYRPRDTSDPYWQLDPLAGRGVREMVFTTYGPLLADPSVLASGRVAEGTTGWVATADFDRLTTEGIAPLREAAAAAPDALREDPVFRGTLSATTGLPEVLERTERALLVARSTLLMVAVQLVLLAGYALLLVARLLSTERAGETALLRARGAARGRIASLAAVEAALLALPAVALAPLLAGPLASLFVPDALDGSAGVRFPTAPGAAVWLVAAATAACCAAAVVAPALAAAGDTVRLRRARISALPAPVRTGADLGLLVIAGVAYWQLDRQTADGGGALGTGPGGTLGIDPLLVAAPALALLAGTVLTLRLLPPAARLAERRAASGRGLTTALAGWQFSRRPLRGTAPVLLLILACAMGMLAVGQGASWDRSQRDQADFRTGAPVRVLGPAPVDGPAGGGHYAAVPGVTSAAPAHRATAELSGGRKADLLVLDTARTPGHLLLRDDVAGGSAGAALRPLAPTTAPAAPLTLPPGTRSLHVDLRITDARGVAGRTRPPTAPAPALVLVLTDRHGLSYRAEAGDVPADGRTHRATVTLGGPDGRTAPAEPLTLTGLRLTGAAGPGPGGEHRLAVERLLTTGATSDPRPLTAGGPLTWRGASVLTSFGEESTPLGLTPASSPAAPLTAAYPVALAPGGDPRYAVRLDLAPGPAPERIPALATDAFLRASGTRPGQSLDLSTEGRTLRVTVVRTTRALPTTGTGTAVRGGTDTDGGALLLDLRAVNAALTAQGQSPFDASEWWLDTAPGRTAAVATALRAEPGAETGRVLVRDETAAALLKDPLGAGPRAALLAVAAAAAALAAVGFAVSAAGSLRERSAETAVLRAIGAPRRSLARMIAAEQGLLVGIGLLTGTLLGALLARAVVPLVTLTAEAAQPVPTVLVELPVGQVLALLAGIGAVPLLITAAVALRRTDPAVSLRHQGDS
ncbi:FtsX-like permease family protein [Streptomyces sp. NPDC097619]|uniref:FtsX-like permease family protein n=1 Tax=Streptomyces sp. NPDC097619 TaxID=3157228 RepID=UPI00331ABA38